MNETPKTNKDNNKSDKTVKKRSSKIPITFVNMFQNIFPKFRTNYRTENKDSKEEEERRSVKKNRKFQNWGVVMNFIMVSAFIFSMWLQWHLTSQTLAYTKLSDSISRKNAQQVADSSYALAIRSIIQAQISAKSADSNSKRIIDSQIEISRTDLRPYLCFSDPAQSPNDLIPIEGTYSPTIIIKNFGKTPAFDVTIVWKCMLRKDFKSERFPSRGDTIIWGYPMTPPGKEIYLKPSTKKNTVTKEDLKEISDGNKTIFFFFWLNYTQHVGSKIISHRTRFCVFYNSKEKFILPYDSVDLTNKGFDFDD